MKKTKQKKIEIEYDARSKGFKQQDYFCTKCNRYASYEHKCHQDQSWEKEFDEYWFISKGRTKGSSNAHRYEVKAFIKVLLSSHRQRIVRDIQKLISERMSQYANTPLSKRRSAFDELYELEKEMDKLKNICSV